MLFMGAFRLIYTSPVSFGPLFRLGLWQLQGSLQPVSLPHLSQTYSYSPAFFTILFIYSSFLRKNSVLGYVAIKISWFFWLIY